MEPVSLNPNLTTPKTFSYKDILVGKLVRAVGCSVISQFLIIFVYIILANVNIFHPIEWLNSILSTFTYISTWIFVVIFSFIIFAQSLICAKDYVLMTSYSSTRFQQFLHIFSFHNFSLLGFHVVAGGAFTWQILVIANSHIKNLTRSCKTDQSCLVGDTFFLILGGFWTGLYFFFKVYLTTKQLVFPVVPQRKFLQFRTNLFILFRQSCTMSLWPCFYYSLFYYIWGNHLESHLMFVFNLDKANQESSFLVYVYLWLFATLYCFSMNLMRFFFSLFLTEPVQFPLLKENIYILTLQEALVMYNLPIIQNLACLDLFQLSQWSPLRRQFIFTLSQPGGHPHTWNGLVENVTRLFTDYTDLLKKTTEGNVQEMVKKTEPITPFSPVLVQSPYSPTRKYESLRNMSLHADYVDVLSVTQNVPMKPFENLKKYFESSIKKVIGFLKLLLGINFLFGELPQVNIQKCLGNGQLIIWATQGISELAVASLNEDQYGIVQKDLPVIITSMVYLKQHLDKLNKVPALSRKGLMDDFNFKMKNAVTAAVKRSLFNLSIHFGEYFQDFQLSKDVLYYLQANVGTRTVN